MGLEKSYIDILIKSSDFERNGTCYVLDTNFLLNALKSVKHADDYIEALRKNKGRVFIPFIVWVEFIYNVDGVIGKNLGHLKAYKNIYENREVIDISPFSLDDVEKKLGNYFNVGRFSKNPIGQKLTEEDIKAVIDDINVESYFENINKEINNSLGKWRTNKETVSLIKRINSYETDTKNRLKTIREMIDKEDIFLGTEYTPEILEGLTTKAEE